MTVTIISDRGVPLMCEHGDAPASASWTDTLGKHHLACQQHNPYQYTATSSWQVSFTSRDRCHACGQPVILGPQQVTYPGTGG